MKQYSDWISMLILLIAITGVGYAFFSIHSILGKIAMGSLVALLLLMMLAISNSISHQ